MTPSIVHCFRQLMNRDCNVVSRDVRTDSEILGQVGFGSDIDKFGSDQCLFCVDF